VNRNRLLLLGGAVAVAAIVVAVPLLLLNNGSGTTGLSTVAVPTTTGSGGSAPAQGSIFAGIPQHGDTLGKPSAPATLVVFEDPQCPFCREWDLESLPSVIDAYVRPGRIKIVYRGIEIIGPNSEPGLRAIYAAGKQNKQWNLIDELYHVQGDENSGWITPAVIRSSAAAVGANGAKILAQSSAPAVTAALQKAQLESQVDRVQGTPSFYLLEAPSAVSQLNVTALDATSFEASLDAALR
jgi:protein-disulfide isomerase